MSESKAGDRIDFEGGAPDWREVVHCILTYTGQSQAELGREIGKSQTAISELFLRITTVPSYPVGRALEAAYSRIPAVELQGIRPAPALKAPGQRGGRTLRAAAANDESISAA